MDSSLKENVPTEVNSLNSSSDDVICLDGPTTSKKLKIDKSESNSNNSSICQIDAENEAEEEEDDVMAPPNQNMPQYLDEEINTRSMMTMNNNSSSNSNSNSNSATNSCSSTSPPPATVSLSANISTSVNSTCDNNLPYTIDLMGSNETTNLREQQQDQQQQPTPQHQLQHQQQQEHTYTHSTAEMEHANQQHQQESMILTNSMQLDNCNDQLLHNPYNNNNMDEDEDDVIEQKFNDAENYVLESGEVTTDASGNGKSFFSFINTILKIVYTFSQLTNI